MAVEYVDVYWGQGKYNPNNIFGDSIFYEDPKTVLSSLVAKKNKVVSGGSFMNCPAVYNLLGNVLVVRSPIDIGVKVKYRENEISKNLDSYGPISWTMMHDPSIQGHPLVILDLPWLFFAEEEIEVIITSPYFENSPHLSQGNVVPGKMNIGAWFRPLNMEFNLHYHQDELNIKEGEAMAYITFLTDKKIRLHRFQTNENIIRLSNMISNTPQWQQKLPLAKRYARFRRAGLKKVVLNEIKNNLVD